MSVEAPLVVTSQSTVTSVKEPASLTMVSVAVDEAPSRPGSSEVRMGGGRGEGGRRVGGGREEGEGGREGGREERRKRAKQ